MFGPLVTIRVDSMTKLSELSIYIRHSVHQNYTSPKAKARILDEVTRLERALEYALQTFTNLGYDDTVDYIEEGYLAVNTNEQIDERPTKPNN